MTTNKNLVDDKFKREVSDKLAQGELPNGKRAVNLYKHPIKNRTIKISEGQRKGVRYGE